MSGVYCIFVPVPNLETVVDRQLFLPQHKASAQAEALFFIYRGDCRFSAWLQTGLPSFVCSPLPSV